MASREEKNKDIQEQIEEEKAYQRRKKIIKTFLKTTIIVVTVFFIIYFYTYYSSTKGIVVKEKRLVEERLPSSFRSVKIIQFSDLYYGTTIYQDELKNLVKQINLRNPDIVVFTGNLISSDYKISLKNEEKIIKELQNINASIGKYAISGKEDNSEDFLKIMTQSNFNVLDNNYDLVYNQDNSPILLVGLSSLINKKRDIDKAYSYYNEPTHNNEIYQILLMSEDDDLDGIISKYHPDLVLAGNSLNGQIRLPIIGGILKKEGSSKYSEAYYKVNNTKIFVSGGIGSPDIGFRFYNNPSINFFRLVNK